VLVLFSKPKLPKVTDDATSFFRLHFMLEFTALETGAAREERRALPDLTG